MCFGYAVSFPLIQNFFCHRFSHCGGDKTKLKWNGESVNIVEDLNIHFTLISENQINI